MFTTQIQLPRSSTLSTAVTKRPPLRNGARIQCSRMDVGGYMLVVEGTPLRKYRVLDSCGAPPEGQELVFEGALYVVTRVRRDQARNERPSHLKHMFPRVFVRWIGDAPDDAYDDEGEEEP